MKEENPDFEFNKTRLHEAFFDLIKLSSNSKLENYSGCIQD